MIVHHPMFLGKVESSVISSDVPIRRSLRFIAFTRDINVSSTAEKVSPLVEIARRAQ
jgi:hypothetical protein